MFCQWTVKKPKIGEDRDVLLISTCKNGSLCVCGSNKRNIRKYWDPVGYVKFFTIYFLDSSNCTKKTCEKSVGYHHQKGVWKKKEEKKEIITRILQSVIRNSHIKRKSRPYVLPSPIPSLCCSCSFCHSQENVVSSPYSCCYSWYEPCPGYAAIPASTTAAMLAASLKYLEPVFKVPATSLAVPCASETLRESAATRRPTLYQPLKVPSNPHSSGNHLIHALVKSLSSL